jgi:O-antigen/teichoic acid export membrane protein
MKLIKGSYTILFFKLAGAALMLGVNLILANNYGAKYLGVFNLIFTILQISSMISRAGLDIYFIKIIPSLNTTSKVTGFLRKSFLRIIFSSIIVSLFLFIIAPLIDDYFFKEFDAAEYIIWISLLLLPYTFFTLIPEILRSYEDVFIYSFIKNLLFQLSLLSSMLFIILLNLGNIINSLNYAIIISSFISLLILYFFLRKKEISFSKNTKYTDPILRNSYHMFLTSSILLFMGNLDQFMIGYFIDEENVGYYSACIRLSVIVTFVLSSVTSYITPKISKAYALKDFSLLKLRYDEASRLIIWSSLPLILILVIFPNFFLGLFGEEFRGLKNIFYVVIGMNVANIFFGPLLYILNLMDLHIYVRNVLFFAFVLNFILNFILIPKYGVTGAAVSTLVATIFWKILLYNKLQSKLKNLYVSN